MYNKCYFVRHILSSYNATEQHKPTGKKSVFMVERQPIKNWRQAKAPFKGCTNRVQNRVS